MHEQKLIFLMSLPRSGSTLLQRMLATLPEIHTVSEPWLLLPLSSTLQNKHTLAMYNHEFASNAIEDFIQTLPNKHRDFYEAIEKFILSLYFNASFKDSAKYFLDKTPRYYMIVKFLSDVFPSAKFIFLFRNPLEVLASILFAQLKNRFLINPHYVDLFYGPQALVEGYHKTKDRSIKINYHDLVNSPDSELERICSFLHIPYDASMSKKFVNIIFKGRLGDQTGIKEYNSISTAPSDKWKTVLNTNYRKKFAKKYIKKMGDPILSVFGASTAELLKEIDKIQNIRSGSIIDFYFHTISTLKRLVLIEHYKKNFQSSRNSVKIFPYL